MWGLTQQTSYSWLWKTEMSLGNAGGHESQERQGCRFSPWVPRKERRPAHCSLWGHKELDMTWPSESQFGSILENCEIMNTATRELINCLLKKLYSMRAMSFSFIWGLTKDWVAQMVKRLPTMWRPGFDPWVRKILWQREWQPTPVLLPGKSHGRLQSMGSQRVGHNWVTKLSFFLY